MLLAKYGTSLFPFDVQIIPDLDFTQKMKTNFKYKMPHKEGKHVSN